MHLGVFVIFNALFICCDVTGWPGWLQKYKVQEDKNVPVSTAPIRVLYKLKLLIELLSYKYYIVIHLDWSLKDHV